MRTNTESRYCECGCGEKVRRRFAQGHNRKNLDTYEVRACPACRAEYRTSKACPRKYCSRKCSYSIPRWAGRDGTQFNGGLTLNRGRWQIHCRDHSPESFARAVVAADLRRPLKSDEIVHHINGDSTDDRIENLAVLTRAEHLRLHRPEFEEKRKRRAAEASRKLTAAEVLEIRSQPDIHRTALAKKFGVGESTIRGILTRKTWNGPPEEIGLALATEGES